VVRWSAAKAVARICERLPSEFAGQIVDTVINLFSIHSAGVASLYDIPSIAESTWQGACLASAELARRGLIPNSSLGTLIDWMLKVSRSFYRLSDWYLEAFRHYRLIYVKALTQWAPVFEIQHHMSCGRWLVHMILPLFNRFPMYLQEN
jgi:hypothetical protein